MKSQTTTILIRRPNNGAKPRGHAGPSRAQTRGPPQIVTPVKQGWSLPEDCDHEDQPREYLTLQHISNNRDHLIRGSLQPASSCVSRPTSSQSLYSQLARQMGMTSTSRWSLNSDDSGKSESGAASSFEDYVSEVTRPGTVHKRGRFIYLTDTDRTEHVGRILKIVPSPTYVAVERAFRPVNFPSVGGPNPTGKLAYLYTDAKKAAAKRQRTTTAMSSETSRPNTRPGTSRMGSATLYNRLTQAGLPGSVRDLSGSARDLSGSARDLPGSVRNLPATGRDSARRPRPRTLSIAESDCFSDAGSV